MICDELHDFLKQPWRQIWIERPHMEQIANAKCVEQSWYGQLIETIDPVGFVQIGSTISFP